MLIGHFNSRSTRHCAVLLLGLCACFCATVEAAARYGFPRISRVRARIETERNRATKYPMLEDRPVILFVGNSLFERGLDVSALQSELPDYDVRRFVLSDTAYEDWFYGLQRLFAEGAKPRVVVLGLAQRNLTGYHFEGDLSAHLLVRTADISRVGQDLNDDNTDLSNLYASNLSAFYGSKTQIRKWLMTTIMPKFPELAGALRPRPASELPPATVESIATLRLHALNGVCGSYGARLIFVLPPLESRQAGDAAVFEAGRQVGVPVLAPIPSGQLGPEYFLDGAHLTEAGAQKFTSSLSAEIGRMLVQNLQARR